MNIRRFNHGRVIRSQRVNKPSEDALLSIVLLGLIASACDGKPDFIEIQTLRDNISRVYKKDPNEVVSFIQIALKLMNNSDPIKLTDSTCDKLKNELNQSQLIEVFDYISDVLVADGRVDKQEEIYLGRLADRLDLLGILRTTVPSLHTH